MEKIERILELDLPENKSAFLWGPRQTGKIHLSERTGSRASAVYDFLKTDLFLEVSKRPSVLREQVEAMGPEALRHPIILDEVQKVPYRARRGALADRKYRCEIYSVRLERKEA